MRELLPIIIVESLDQDEDVAAKRLDEVELRQVLVVNFSYINQLAVACLELAEL